MYLNKFCKKVGDFINKILGNFKRKGENMENLFDFEELETITVNSDETSSTSFGCNDDSLY